MSIWSTFHTIEPLRERQRGRDVVVASYVDLADTGVNGQRGDLLRLSLSITEPASGSYSISEASGVLDRAQATELRDRLSQWLAHTNPDPATAARPDLCNHRWGAGADWFTGIHVCDDPADHDQEAVPGQKIWHRCRCGAIQGEAVPTAPAT